MKKLILIYTTILALLVINSCGKKNTSTSSAPSSPEEKAMARINEIESSDKIEWLDYNEAINLAKYKPKKIFVDVYTNWCGWCKRMDATSFKDPDIIRYVNQNYYAVKLNAESNKKLTYNGRELNEASLAQDVFGATGFPTTVYLTSDQKLLQPVPGYLDVDMLSKILHFYGEDAYKTTTWENYSMSYSGE
jgi:thioredoxin-related protein